MNEVTADVIKHIAEGIGVLILVGILAWCGLEETKIKNGCYNRPNIQTEVKK